MAKEHKLKTALMPPLPDNSGTLFFILFHEQRFRPKRTNVYQQLDACHTREVEATNTLRKPGAMN